MGARVLFVWLACITVPWVVTLTLIFGLHYWFSVAWILSILLGSVIATCLLIAIFFSLLRWRG